MLSWYSPGATNPANLTVAGTPPMVQVTVLVVGGAPLKVWPKLVVGLVGPNMNRAGEKADSTALVAGPVHVRSVRAEVRDCRALRRTIHRAGQFVSRSHGARSGPQYH